MEKEFLNLNFIFFLCNFYRNQRVESCGGFYTIYILHTTRCNTLYKTTYYSYRVTYQLSWFRLNYNCYYYSPEILSPLIILVDSLSFLTKTCLTFNYQDNILSEWFKKRTQSFFHVDYNIFYRTWFQLNFNTVGVLLLSCNPDTHIFTNYFEDYCRFTRENYAMFYEQSRYSLVNFNALKT